MATLSGDIKHLIGNTGLPWLIRAYRRKTGAYVDQVLADENGLFSITTPFTDEHFCTAHSYSSVDVAFPSKYKIAAHFSTNLADVLGNTVTAVGNAVVSGGFLNLDGNGDYVYFNSPGAPGTSDFFIRLLYTPNSISADGALYDGRPTGTNGYYLSLFLKAGGGIEFMTNAVTRISASGVFTVGVETEVILCRLSGITRIFADGVQRGSSYVEPSPTPNNYIVASNRPTVGANGASTAIGFLNGKLRELSQVNAGRYGAAFTPDYSPFVEGLIGGSERPEIIDRLVPV